MQKRLIIKSYFIKMRKVLFTLLSFWTLYLAIVVSDIVVNSMLINFTPYLTDIGTSAQVVVLLILLDLDFVIVAKLVTEKLCDKFEMKIILFIICVTSMVSFIFLKKGSFLVFGILFSIFNELGLTAFL